MFLIDAKTQRSFTLQPGATIGRDDSASIVLKDRTVSRRHAVVVEGPEGLMLNDLGSRAGTFVDGQRINSHHLIVGSEVGFGNVRLSVSENADVTVTLDPRVAPINKLEFRSAYDIIDPVVLRNDYERLRMVFELTRAIDIEQNIDRILELILTTAFRLLSAERGIIQLFEDSGFDKTSAHTRSGPVDDLSLSQTVIQEVVRDRKGLIVANAQAHTVFSRAESICVDAVRSVMCVPLIYEETVLGVIQVDSRHTTHAFDERDLVLLSTIASHSALIIKEVAARTATARAQQTMDLQRLALLERLSTGIIAVAVDGTATPANSAGRAALDALSVDGSAPTGAAACIDDLRGLSPQEERLVQAPSPGPSYLARCIESSDDGMVLVLQATTRSI